MIYPQVLFSLITYLNLTKAFQISRNKNKKIKLFFLRNKGLAFQHNENKK